MPDSMTALFLDPLDFIEAMYLVFPNLRNYYVIMEHIVITTGPNYKHKTQVVIKWNFPLRRTSTKFISANRGV